MVLRLTTHIAWWELGDVSILASTLFVSVILVADDSVATPVDTTIRNVASSQSLEVYSLSPESDATLQTLQFHHNMKWRNHQNNFCELILREPLLSD